MDDDAPTHESAQRSFWANATWRASSQYRALADRFDGLPDKPETSAHAARTLLCDDERVGALIAPLIDAVAADPWYEPPFKASRNALRTGVVLFETAAVTLTAAILSADALAALPPARSVVVPGRLSVVRYVRAGGARLRLWHAEPAGPDFSAALARPCAPLGLLPLGDGVVLTIDGRRRAQLLENAASDVVTLTATIRPGASPFMRDYDRTTGALLRVAMLDDQVARTQMLLAHLRLTGRTEATERFEAATHEPAFFLRWAAMREWIALDAVAALPRLRAMATTDPNVEVRHAAQVTLALVERQQDGTLCPA